MQQSCQKCGFESPISDRFCRQCGSGLIVETDASVATTRNYGRQEPAPSVANINSGYLPPSVGDAIAGETERYYQAPSAPSPFTSPTAPIKPRRRFRRWSFIMLVLLIGTMIGAVVTGSLIRSNQNRRGGGIPVRNQYQDEAQRRQDEQRRRTEDRLREVQDRAREAKDRQLEAVERAREAAERASEAGAALVPAGEKLLDLGKYEFPGATLASAIRIPGHEILSMRTSDGFDDVAQYYQKIFGKPIIQINEPWEKKLLFQSDTDPPISVLVENDFARPGPQLKIVVLRSPFRFLRPIEAQIPK